MVIYILFSVAYVASPNKQMRVQTENHQQFGPNPDDQQNKPSLLAGPWPMPSWPWAFRTWEPGTRVFFTGNKVITHHSDQMQHN